MELGEYYCLRNRNNFNIKPETDQELYFGRKELQEDLKRIIERSFTLGNPLKLVITGIFGSGKTHTLHHLKYILEKDYNCKVILTEIGDVTKKTMFATLHNNILDIIGLDEISSLLRRYQQLEAQENPDEDFDANDLLKKILQSENISIAFATLTLYGQHKNVAWKWLKGGNLNGQELSQIGITTNLSESNDMVKILTFIAGLYKKVLNRKLVVMIDEAEKLKDVKEQEAIANWSNANRLLADQSNDTLSFIYSIAGRGEIDELPEMFSRREFVDRIGKDNNIPLTTLNIEEINEFLEDLLNTIIDKAKAIKILSDEEHDEEKIRKYYPFTEDSYRYFIEDVLSRIMSFTPRILVKILNNLAFGGYMAKKRFFDIDLIEKTPLLIE
ncbi:MAG: hypothetical protein ACTSQE_07675 [Candidatus Heimdallarchaeaceae archaeon]